MVWQISVRFMVPCLLKSQRGWGTTERTKGRGKTLLTTTEIRSGCSTIYNLPSLLCDSRRGWREREREADTQTGRPVNSTGKEKTIVYFPVDRGPLWLAYWVRRHQPWKQGLSRAGCNWRGGSHHLNCPHWSDDKDELRAELYCTVPLQITHKPAHLCTHKNMLLLSHLIRKRTL